MLDHLRRVLGGDDPIAVFAGDTVASACCRREAVLLVGLTLGIKTHFVSEESRNRTWLTRRDEQNFSLVMWTVVCAECAGPMISQRC
ncbi:hypothetical protein CDL15_Pgr005001 [Punica granatum]|uniref:Uncharacterized protein n=1 Tax=Punica granatum TaxID=22663 RepID=A0A218WRC2_PUNGR|nr:hypothetical protein CDL15_Pgr005001 [Punica granatum]